MMPFIYSETAGSLLSVYASLLNPEKKDNDVEAEAEEGDEEKEHSPVGTALLYIPNRIFDALEIVRAGVNAGFGFGVDCRATWVAQAVFIHDSSVGLGFQGVRHLPVCGRLAHTSVGVGPIKTPSLGLFDWPINDYDIRIELFIAVVGAHVAVDLEAIADFVTGFFLFDISDDDFVFGG
ncbi:MAG: hypothetical protein ABIK28_02225 [Planctomycetota bacterium]